jgi:hypothetical protein
MSDEHDFNLITPLVVCISNGGPFDDHAFVSGVHYAEWRSRLQVGRPTVLEGFEYPDLRPQLELLAMELGYTFTFQSYSDDWELVKFSRECWDLTEPENSLRENP